jgi:hypothetical protein
VQDTPKAESRPDGSTVLADLAVQHGGGVYPDIGKYVAAIARTRGWSDSAGTPAVDELVKSAMEEYQRERFLHHFAEGPGSSPYDEVSRATQSYLDGGPREHRQDRGAELLALQAAFLMTDSELRRRILGPNAPSPSVDNGEDRPPRDEERDLTVDYLERLMSKYQFKFGSHQARDVVGHGTQLLSQDDLLTLLARRVRRDIDMGGGGASRASHNLQQDMDGVDQLFQSGRYEQAALALGQSIAAATARAGGVRPTRAFVADASPAPGVTMNGGGVGGLPAMNLGGAAQQQGQAPPVEGSSVFGGTGGPGEPVSVQAGHPVYAHLDHQPRGQGAILFQAGLKPGGEKVSVGEFPQHSSGGGGSPGGHGGPGGSEGGVMMSPPPVGMNGGDGDGGEGGGEGGGRGGLSPGSFHPGVDTLQRGDHTDDQFDHERTYDDDAARRIIKGARRRSIDNGTYTGAKSPKRRTSNSSGGQRRTSSGEGKGKGSPSGGGGGGGDGGGYNNKDGGGSSPLKVNAPLWVSPDELAVYRSDKELRSAVLSAAEGIKLRAAQRKRGQLMGGGLDKGEEIEELRKGGARDYAQPWSGTKMDHPDHAPKGAMRTGLGIDKVTAYTPPRVKDLADGRPSWNPSTLTPPKPRIRVHQCYDPDTSVLPFHPATPPPVPDIYFKENVLPEMLARVVSKNVQADRQQEREYNRYHQELQMAEHARLADLERDAAGNGVPRRRARGVSVEYDAAALLLGYSRKTTQDLPDAKETKGPRPNTHAGPGAHYGSGEYKFSESQGASSGPGAAAASISHIVQKRLRYDKNLAEQARQEAAEADRAKWEAREREMKGGDQEGEEEEEEAHGLLGGPPRRMGQRRRSYRESRVNEEDREAYHDYEVQKGIYTEGSAARALALPSHDVRDWIAKDPQLAAGKRQSDRIVAARAEGYVHPEKQFHKDAITREMDEVRFQ